MDSPAEELSDHMNTPFRDDHGQTQGNLCLRVAPHSFMY